jgi:hypothetical protein
MPHPALVAATLSIAALAAAADSVRRDLESDPAGSPPAGYEFARTGNGAEGRCVVRSGSGSGREPTR